jgi:hypothetical protein
MVTSTKEPSQTNFDEINKRKGPEDLPDSADPYPAVLGGFEDYD